MQMIIPIRLEMVRHMLLLVKREECFVVGHTMPMHKSVAVLHASTLEVVVKIILLGLDWYWNAKKLTSLK